MKYFFFCLSILFIGQVNIAAQDITGVWEGIPTSLHRNKQYYGTHDDTYLTLYITSRNDSSCTGVIVKKIRSEFIIRSTFTGTFDTANLKIEGDELPSTEISPYYYYATPFHFKLKYRTKKGAEYLEGTLTIDENAYNYPRLYPSIQMDKSGQIPIPETRNTEYTIKLKRTSQSADIVNLD